MALGCGSIFWSFLLGIQADYTYMQMRHIPLQRPRRRSEHFLEHFIFLPSVSLYSFLSFQLHICLLFYPSTIIVFTFYGMRSSLLGPYWRVWDGNNHTIHERVKNKQIISTLTLGRMSCVESFAWPCGRKKNMGWRHRHGATLLYSCH